MGAATIYAGWQGSKAINAVGAAQIDQSALNVGFKYVMGVNTFMGQYARLSGAASNAQIVAGQSNAASTIGLGYEYALAKNASINARYERVSDNKDLNAVTAASLGGLVAGTPTQDRTRMGVGIRYNF